MRQNSLAIVISEMGSDTNWLGTTRSLGQKGIQVIKLSPKGWYPSKYCSTVISPIIAEEPQKYLAFLIDLGERLVQKDAPKPFLMPASDNALILLSKNKRALEEFFVPVAADWDCVSKIVDKSKTYAAAQKVGIRVPKTFSLEDASELNDVAKNLPFPCLIKPAHSHIFSLKYKVKLLEVNSEEQLIKTCKPLLAEGYKLLLQEKIVGGDDQIFAFQTCFNKNSEPLTVFTQQKLRQHPPHFGIGSFAQSVWNPKVMELGLKLLKEIRFFGIGAVEFKQDPLTGDYVLIEINGRSDTRMYLATACGLNIPYVLYKDLIIEKQKPIDEYKCEYKTGIQWIHLKLDFLTMLKKRKIQEITTLEWLRSLIMGKKSFGIFSFNDLSPFLSEIKASTKLLKQLSIDNDTV